MLTNFKSPLLALVLASGHVSALAGINRIANISATDTAISASSIGLSAPATTFTLTGTSVAPTYTSIPSISASANNSVPTFIIPSTTSPIETPVPTNISISMPPISVSATSIPALTSMSTDTSTPGGTSTSANSSLPPITMPETSMTAPSITVSVSYIYPSPVPTESAGSDLHCAAQSSVPPFTVEYYDSAAQGLSAFARFEEKIDLVHKILSEGGKIDGDWFNLTGGNNFTVKQAMNITAKLGGQAFNLTDHME